MCWILVCLASWCALRIVITHKDTLRLFKTHLQFSLVLYLKVLSTWNVICEWIFKLVNFNIVLFTVLAYVWCLSLALCVCMAWFMLA